MRDFYDHKAGLTGFEIDKEKGHHFFKSKA